MNILSCEPSFFRQEAGDEEKRTGNEELWEGGGQRLITGRWGGAERWSCLHGGMKCVWTGMSWVIVLTVTLHQTVNLMTTNSCCCHGNAREGWSLEDTRHECVNGSDLHHSDFSRSHDLLFLSVCVTADWSLWTVSDDNLFMRVQQNDGDCHLLCNF